MKTAHIPHALLSPTSIRERRTLAWNITYSLILAFYLVTFAAPGSARDLDAILADGVLRHLAIPYANFDTGRGDGLDVELIQGFARELGVRYERVETDWRRVIGDLTGRHVQREGEVAKLMEATPVRGDLIANGMTILEWRKEVVAFSDPTFPSAIWLVARADSELAPIVPTEDLQTDIRRVRAKLPGRSVLALPNTCLDPELYDMEETGASVILPPRERKLNEMVPAILNRDAETTLLDVPDVLIALERWPGQIKVIGPIAGNQQMAVAFRQSSPVLRRAFNDYLWRIRRDGSYNQLVKKYYPVVFRYFGDFFVPGAGD